MAVAQTSPPRQKQRKAADRGIIIVLASWALLILGLILARPLEGGGDFVIAHTIHIALLFYFLAAVLMLRWRDDPSGPSVARVARACWSLAWLTFVAHMWAAFQYFHHWDHAHAIEHTREVSGVGWGIFVTYFFALAWGLDVVHWWLRPSQHAARPRWQTWCLQGFMAFIIFNGTVIYEKGPIVWAGAAMFVILGAWTVSRITTGGTVRQFVWACLVLSSVLGLAMGQTPDQKKETVAFVRSLQAKDGGFLLKPGLGGSSLRATSSALRALKYFGGEPADRAGAASFVELCFDPAAGAFADRPGGKVDVFTTAVGYMALVELKLPADTEAGRALRSWVISYLGKNAKGFEEIRIAAAGLEALGTLPPQADQWLQEIARLRHEDGTAGTGNGAARETGRVTVTMLRLKGKVDQLDSVTNALKRGQRADGGFGTAGDKGSDLESTYQVMRAFHMLKLAPNTSKLRDFISSCRNADGGYGTAPGKPSIVPACYYAAIILHWLGDQ